METNKKTDLVIVTDSTGSMRTFLQSLSKSLKEIVQIIDITNILNRISIIAYYDYCDKNIIEFSGWINLNESTEIVKLMPFITKLTATGGGDIPEAAKTAANKLLDIVSDSTIVFWYTDAPPHHSINYGENYPKEKLYLETNKKIFDWYNLCNELRKKNITVYPIINTIERSCSSFYVMMSTITLGKTLYITNTNAKLISQTSIKLFLGLMGCDYQFKDDVWELVYEDKSDFGKIVNENSSNGYLPGFHPEKKIINKTLEITTHPSLVMNLRTLVDLFHRDIHYKDRIYTLFGSLLNPDSVLALTYNVIFATFWRLISRNFDDPRRELLRNKLSETMESLKKNNKPDHLVVIEWINDSFNQTYEVNEIIIKAKTKVPALVLDTSRYYAPVEFLELGKSCNQKVLSIIVDMMSNMRVIDNENDLPKTSDEMDRKGRPLPLKYIPLSLPNKQFFGTLPHLTAPGTLFTMRQSLIMAALAFITNNTILEKRAEEHLQYNKGKWIDTSNADNYAGGFINLMLKVPEFLTNEEIEFLKFYQRVYGLVINGTTDITVELPFAPYKKVCYDYKKRCDGCGHKRSFTLLTRVETENDLMVNYVCGLCLSDPSYMAAEPKDEDHSYYLECKSCLCHYALVNVDRMNVTPKCHGCRHGIKQPSVQCIKCFNSYVDPAKLFRDVSNSFVCPQCNVNPKLSIDEIKVPFKDIYNQNQPILYSCMGFEMPTDINIFAGHSLFAIKDGIKKCEQIDLNSAILKFNRKTVINTHCVLQEMLKWINSGVAEQSYCTICFNEFYKNNLRKVCGRKLCRSLACDECLKSWYGVNKPGDLLQINSLTCPFCKQYPSYSILSTYNKEVCAMVQTTKTFDINWWYGWCLTCFQPKKIIERECSRDAPQLNRKFICEDCNKCTKPDDSKQCPNKGCQIAIIKNGGCNHMECTACKKHFCWICADMAYSTSAETYDHLYKAHGGAFGYNADDDDQEYVGENEDMD